MSADNASDQLDVVIVGFDADDDAVVLAGLARVFNMDEASGRKLLATLPSTVARGVPPVRARYLLRALKMIEARVEVRDPDGSVVDLQLAPPSAPKPAPKPAPASGAAQGDAQGGPTPAATPPSPSIAEAKEPQPATGDSSRPPPMAPPPTASVVLGTSSTVVATPAPGAVRHPAHDPAAPRVSRTTLAEGQPLPPGLGAAASPLDGVARPSPQSAPTATSPAPHVPAPVLPAAAPAPNPPAGYAPQASMVGPWGDLHTKDPSYISAPTPGPAPTAPKHDAVEIPAPALPLPDAPAAAVPRPASSPRAGADPLALTAPQSAAGPLADPLGVTAADRGPGRLPPADPLAVTAPPPPPFEDGNGPAVVIKPEYEQDDSAFAPTGPLQPVQRPAEAGRAAAEAFSDFVRPGGEGGEPRGGNGDGDGNGNGNGNTSGGDSGAQPRSRADARLRPKPDAAPAGFTHGGIDISPRRPAEATDGNLDFAGDDDERISLAPRDDTGVSLPDGQPMDMLPAHQQPSRESVDGYRHPVARSQALPRADSPLSPAAHPGYQQPGAPDDDTRPFWATMGEGMLLPFMGSGTGWIIAIGLWSAVIGGVSILFDVLPGTLGALAGAALTVWLSGSVVAFAADYYRTCVWAVLSRRDAPSEKPSLERVYGEYLGSSLHFVLFGVIAFAPLIGWSFLALSGDDASTRGFVTSPITLLLLALPNLYFPMALATAALGNRPSAIWQVGFGVGALMRAPVEYAFIVGISTGASLFASAPFIIAGTLLEMQGWFFLASMGFPMAIGCGIQAGLMGQLMRARPETFGE